MSRAESLIGEPPPAVTRSRAPVARGVLPTADRWCETMEEAGVPLLAALSFVYWGVTWAFAERKLLWNDELYTYYMARLPSMSDVWSALLARGEQTPPLFYAVTRLSWQIFGVNNVSMRLPEMLGVWVMCGALYAVVARRTTPLAGLCAASAPLVTSAYPYAFEARAYGVLLGAAALSLFFWQSISMANGSGRRTLALGVFCLSVAATMSSHYYGVFAILPIALGQAVRDVQCRRVDIGIWSAIVVAAVPLFWQLPLIRAGAGYAAAFWSPPQWVNIPDFYTDLLAPALVPLVAVLILVSAYATVAGSDRPLDRVVPRLPAPEVAAAAGFVLIPIVCVVVAKVMTGAFVNRYALPAVIGFALLAGYASALWFRRHAAGRLLVVVFVVGWFGLTQAREWLNATGASMPVSQESIERPERWIQSTAQPDLPVVIADPHTFVVLSHYATPSVRERMVYLADPDLALRRLGHNSVERGMLDLVKPWFGMNVDDFQSYVATHDRFLVYGDFVRRAFLNWIVPELQARRMRLILLNRAGDNMLLLADRPHEHAGRDDGWDVSLALDSAEAAP